MKLLRSYIASIIFIILGCAAAAAQDKYDTLTLKPSADTLVPTKYDNEYLDTVKIKKRFILNDYSMIGVEYGVSMNRMMFQPTRKQSMQVRPGTIGVFYMKYGKMFGYMPYFGYKVGIRYTSEGYKFKEDKQTGSISNIRGATEAKMDFLEVPLLAHFHIDMLHFKVMAELGIYGGYRLNIERIGDNVPDSLRTSFHETDRRFDFGVLAGVGFGIVFDPIEFHVNGTVRYGWGTLYDPDYYSPYYYRYAYPFNVMITAGVYFQLTRRNGKSKAMLRREARDAVYNPQIAR